MPQAARHPGGAGADFAAGFGADFDFGAAGGDLVEVATSRAKVEVRAKAGRKVRPGTAWMPRRLRHVWINQLQEPGGATFIALKKLQDAPLQDEMAATHSPLE